MSYQVLARKWRPKSFEELVGQKQTAKALTNALESQRLHHAYLFTGTRGVGKTTIARILSKSLNCEKGITSKPCGVCSSCTEIDQGNFVDLMEIDAASKTKVEDTRELLDNVQYRPTRGRYKVYLIDEVHMLSGHSFNALLKTLEEPPPHVIFLLATTDPQKLPVTVLSRCLQFHLKRMEQDDIVSHLSMILNAENITFEPLALVPIAKGADGSMRDALSLLDQAIAFSGEHLKADSVLEMLGSIDQSYCFKLLESIQKCDATNLMAIIQELSQYSPDYFEVMSDWLSLLHNIAVAQAIGKSDDEQILAFSKVIPAADLQLYYQLSLQAKKDLPFAPHPRQGFEMAMLRVIAFKPVTVPHMSPDPFTPEPTANKLTTENVKKKLTDSVSEPNLQASTNALNTNTTSNHNQIAQSGSVQAAVQQLKKQLDEVKLNEAKQEAAQDVQLEPPVSINEQYEQHEQNEQNINNNQREHTLKLVSNNTDLAQAEYPGLNDSKLELTKKNISQLSQLSHIEDSIDKNQQPVQKSNHHQVREVNANIEHSNFPTNSNNETVSAVDHQKIKASDITVDDINSLEKLYPNAETIFLNSISFENWHFVVDQLPIAANGVQVLLNSMATFENGCLKINHLEKVSEFLTENLTESLQLEIKKHFSTESNSENFKVEFNAVKELPETPKVKQIKLHQEALENAYQFLINDPCVSKLQQVLGATLNKKTINLR